MTRRDLLAGLLAAPLAAQEVLPERIVYRDYPRCLPDYLRALAAEAYAQRSKALSGITTAESVRARQKWARETFWNLAGGMPERTPLNTRVTGEFDRPSYSVQKLVYESQPGYFVSANLYIPKKWARPHPGVLFQMGHSPNGKAADSYQRCCQGLVQLGYLVLAFDPMGQGERINYPRANGKTRLSSVDAEHTVPGRQMLLLGDTATRWQVWDAIRSLDVLADHPLVDRKRLGSTGQSGGATLTMMLATVDDRLTAAVVSSGNTENVACADFHPPGSTDDAEQDFVASGPLGFDRWDLLWPFAPKPLLIISSAKDFFGTYSPSYEQSGLEEYARLSAAYGLLGGAAYIKKLESPLPHGLSYSQRVATYRFFEGWLKMGAQPILAEPPTQPEKDEVLFATGEGSVNRSLHSSTPVELMRSQLDRIKTPGAMPDLKVILGVARPSRVQPKILGTVPSAGCTIQAIEAQSARQVWTPAWVFVPREKPRVTLLLLDPAGRNQHWHEGDLGHQLAARGVRLIAADVRGIGDLQPEFSPGAPAYTRDHQSEEDYAWSSLIFGHSLLGQRVADILSLINEDGILVAARGKLTVPALCAAALDRRIAGLYLAEHLLSWRNVVETENYHHTLANFVPGVLHHTDLPQIANACAPRRVVLAGVVDAAGAPVEREKAGLEYHASHIDVQGDVRWTSDDLLRFCQLPAA